MTQVVDRQITRRSSDNENVVVDADANKLCIVLARDALVSIAYTGVAVVNQTWTDCVIAECLAHRELSHAIIQPGSTYLNRSIHIIIKELCLNLNAKINSDKRSRLCNLRLSIVGFHLNGAYTPLAWDLSRGGVEKNGNRYFRIKKNKAGKFLRENPTGLWANTLGDTGKTIDEGVQELAYMPSLTHDDVERHVSNIIKTRSTETNTVSRCCISVQLAPFSNDGQVQVTFYPLTQSPFLSPWILTSRMISSPALATSSTERKSECGNYVIGGFEDCNTNLKVLTRIPTEHKETDNKLIQFSTKNRIKTC